MAMWKLWWHKNCLYSRLPLCKHYASARLCFARGAFHWQFISHASPVRWSPFTFDSGSPDRIGWKEPMHCTVVLFISFAHTTDAIRPVKMHTFHAICRFLFANGKSKWKSTDSLLNRWRCCKECRLFDIVSLNIPLKCKLGPSSMET